MPARAPVRAQECPARSEVPRTEKLTCRLKLLFDLILKQLQLGEHAEGLLLAGPTGHLDVHAVICFVIAEFQFNQIDTAIVEVDQMALYLWIGSERNRAAAGLDAGLADKIEMLSVRNITAAKALREHDS